MLEKNLDKIELTGLCSNPAGIPLLERLTDGFTKELNNIHWMSLSSNKNALPVLLRHRDKINWADLSRNPSATHIIEELLNNDPSGSMQIVDNIMETLKGKKMSWMHLSQNPKAIHLLEQNVDKVDWSWLSTNESIIEVDNNKYIQLKMKCAQLLYDL